MDTTQVVDEVAVPAAAETETGSEAEKPRAGGDGTETMSVDEARKLRREAQGLRKRLAAYEQVEEEQAATATTRIGELEMQLTDAQRELQNALVRNEVLTHAQTLGLVSVDAAVRLLPDGALQFDEQGRPTNVADALTALLKTYPWLRRQSEVPDLNARTATEQANGNDREEALRKRFRI